jgi:arylsulfatase A-like enzyme
MQKFNFQTRWRASAFALTCLPLAATLLPGEIIAGGPQAPSSKPNIIFILCDDLGWKDLGCYGSTFYETPNLDRLAARGMKFMNGYASSPVCSPSRSSIMTGQYPVHTGITDWIPGARNLIGPDPDMSVLEPSFVQDLSTNGPTIAQALKAGGYATCFAGKWHLGLNPKNWPQEMGFDYNYGGWAAGNPRAEGMGGYFSPWHNPFLPDAPKGTFLTDELTTKTIEFIQQEVKAGKPFFADLSFYAVHEPIEAKPEYIKKFKEKAHRLGLDQQPQFVKDEPWMLTYPSFKERIIQSDPVYAGLIYSVDENVGRVMDTLEQLGIASNTVVVFSSDNGGLSTAEGSPTSNLPLRDGKGWTYEGGVRVPLIVDWPGVTAGGAVCKFPVVNTDFYPTFLDMACLPQRPEESMDGVSLAPLLHGEPAINQPVIYWHYPHYGDQGGSPSSALRMGDWKLVQFYGDNHVELYNLASDVEERRDLAKALAEKTAELLKLLNEWKFQTHAKIPEINPYYNPGEFVRYLREHGIDNKWSGALQPFRENYDRYFSTNVFDPNRLHETMQNYHKLYGFYSGE